jgi:outer membrane receptor for ferric coprogen and ferric-rhodotorulic acid
VHGYASIPTGPNSAPGFTGNDTDVNGNALEAWGMHAGIGFSVSETTTANIHFGYEEALELSTGVAATDFGQAWTVGGNIIWQPVKQMKMGWEINYGEAESFDGVGIKTEALQAVWGTWFYF